MKEEQTPSQKRKRLRSAILVGLIALVLILFFAAPIIPVDGTSIVRGYPCGTYTDWQSPSYNLLNIGYHYSVRHTFCLREP